MNKQLKLIAQTPDDLEILSALLQDMTVRVGDIKWQPAEQRFACIGNRYIWEKKRLFRRPKGERVRTAFHFDNVQNVQLMGIDTESSDTVLNLLNIETNTLDTGYRMVLNFAGGSAIAINAETIDAVASDVSETWQAIARPDHA